MGFFPESKKYAEGNHSHCSSHRILFTVIVPVLGLSRISGDSPDPELLTTWPTGRYCGGDDDAVAIKSGWNGAGIAFGRPSRNILVRNATSGCRGGFTIGSEMSGGVQIQGCAKGRGGAIAAPPPHTTLHSDEHSRYPSQGISDFGAWGYYIDLFGDYLHFGRTKTF